jgi:mannitol/fructose-specific phosphotransferase system IIA component (Ntr-type)
MIAPYLSCEKILLNFEAKGFKQTIKKMLVNSSEKNYALIIDEMTKREALMPTALGQGIALPRIVLESKPKTEIIVAISPKGIFLNSFDRMPVKIIFLFLFSKKDNFASILAQSLRFLNDNNLRAELLHSKTAEEVIKSIKEWEQG